MASREVVPATKGLPLSSNKTTSSKSPYAPDHHSFRQGHEWDHTPSSKLGAGTMLNYGDDHSSRQNHELDHNPIKPLTHPALLGGVKGHTLRGGRVHDRDHERGFFSSDDSALSKQILATHAPDMVDLNVKPVLSIVEDILRLGRPSTSETSPVHAAQVQTHLETIDEHKKALHSSHQDDKIFYNSEHESDIIRFLAYPISKITCEIICKCASGGEAHSVTMDLLRSLSNYSWDAKVVITFAAFAINFGEFWLVEHLQTKNPLAKNIATLKDLPHVMENAGRLEKKFEAVLDLLNCVLKVTHCLVEFKDLPSEHISPDSPEIVAATAHIPTAVYWIIRSLLTCASTLLNLIGSSNEYITSTSESWEIQSLAHKLSVILEYLQKQLASCKGVLERKLAEYAYAEFKRLIESTHIDNMKVLRAMIRAKEDQMPLYDGSKRINERLEVLRTKYVLLLISDLDIPQEELNVLHMIYNQQARRHEYEVLWLPIVDPATQTTTAAENTEFYNLRNNSIPWYSVDHPSLVEPVAKRYIREELKFVHMPMLIVLDPHGKLSKADALPMMWIWGSEAFPFTKQQEMALWRGKTWNIELFADTIDPRIPDWIRSNSVICLYGGEDIEWIRKFTLSARAAAIALHVPLEMLYVGKRNPKERVRRCHEVIQKEQLSHIFSATDYYDYVWYFWVRLWSMWNSKKQVGMNIDNDHIMQQIMDILTYDSSEQGWAVFSRGNEEITKGKGDVVLPVMERYSTWGYKVDHPDRFVAVVDEEIRNTHPEHHCNRLILPGHAGYIPERVVCSECGKTMDKFVMYRCCND